MRAFAFTGGANLRGAWSPVRLCLRFVYDDIACGSEKANLARAIIQLGRTLNLDIVAEGIEHPGQVTELLRLHCRLAQGFHFAKPLTAEALEDYLQSHRGMDAPKPVIVAV